MINIELRIEQWMIWVTANTFEWHFVPIQDSASLVSLVNRKSAKTSHQVCELYIENVVVGSHFFYIYKWIGLWRIDNKLFISYYETLDYYILYFEQKQFPMALKLTGSG